MLKFYKTPEGKAHAKAQSDFMLKFYKTPEGKAHAKAHSKAHSDFMLKFYKTPEGKAHAKAHSDFMLKYYKTPEGKRAAKATGARLAQLYKENIEAWRYVVGKINAKYEAAPLGQGSFDRDYAQYDKADAALADARRQMDVLNFGPDARGDVERYFCHFCARCKYMQKTGENVECGRLYCAK
ncbi:hypothetical protein JL720_11092 [Aureococcus anophagefferens]|nr:hypothetical protein JL720_11092 [Aureococcus anophagefferens]